MGGVNDGPPKGAVPRSRVGDGKTPSSGLTHVVVPNMSGEGLPYAPENWPQPGDKWRWKVGGRVTTTGHYHDRFIRPPARLGRAESYCAKGPWIASKISLSQLVRDIAPGTDLDAFFASFEWKIPSPSFKEEKDIKRRICFSPYSKKINMNGPIDSRTTVKPKECKAGNTTCPPRVQAKTDNVQVMDCDICCSESGFCRDCCCILCGKTTGSIEEGYRFIKCEAVVAHKCICGHLAHLDCAINASLAGTVSGSIKLDADYYCRRCDNKSDIVPYLKRMLDDCKSINSRKHVKKFLDLALCILSDSKKTEAQKLRCNIESLVLKLRDGVKLNDIWELEDTAQTTMKEESNARNDVTMLDAQNGTDDQEACGTCKYAAGPGASDLHKTAKIESLTDDFLSRNDQAVSLELQNKIEHALADLKKSQEVEYLLAENKLYAQKDLLLGIYQDLDSGKLQLDFPATPPSATNSDTTVDVESRVQQIMQEKSKLDDMMQIVHGFGKAPETTHKKYFGAYSRHKS